MAKFNDVLDQFGENEFPEGFLDSLITAYDEDMSIPNAKVAQVETERDEFAAKVNELKVQNFDLIRNGNGGGNGNGESKPEPEPEYKPKTINDLFE